MSQSKYEVCHLLGSLGSGGRESLILDIVRNTKDSIDFSLCCFKSDNSTAIEFEKLGVDVRNFQFSDKFDVLALARLYWHLNKSNIDILHLHGPRAQVPGRVLGRLAGVGGIVSTHHGVQGMFPEVELQFERATRFLDSKTVAVSYGVQHSFINRSSSDQWSTIHNGIDVEKFESKLQDSSPDAVYDHYGLDNDLVLLNVGRYVPPKNQHDLIRAMDMISDRVSNVHLFIIGGRGAMESRLRKSVDERGLGNLVTVTGYVENIYDYYSAADAFVSSSTKEGLPIVLLEAMAARLPVVATKIPGVEDLVIDGDSGILVEPKKPEELADAIVELKNPDLRHRYSEAGAERVRSEFSIDNTVEGYLSIYEDIMS